MASVLRVLLLIAAMAGVVAAARPMEPAAAECGREAHGAVCLFRACCSADGQCGGSGACGVGCQSGPCEDTVVATEPAAECGKQASYAECWPRSQCCNAAGMCGSGDAFCGNGCQGGSCYASPFNLN